MRWIILFVNTLAPSITASAGDDDSLFMHFSTLFSHTLFLNANNFSVQLVSGGEFYVFHRSSVYPFSNQHMQSHWCSRSHPSFSPPPGIQCEGETYIIAPIVNNKTHRKPKETASPLARGALWECGTILSILVRFPHCPTDCLDWRGNPHYARSIFHNRRGKFAFLFREIGFVYIELCVLFARSLGRRGRKMHQSLSILVYTHTQLWLLCGSGCAGTRAGDKLNPWHGWPGPPQWGCWYGWGWWCWWKSHSSAHEPIPVLSGLFLMKKIEMVLFRAACLGMMCIEILCNVGKSIFYIKLSMHSQL